MKSVYLQNYQSSMARLLSLIDRSESSDSFGSADRAYWWYRKSDFSSAIHQQCVLSLALAYTIESENNFFYKNKNIKELIVAALNHACKIQNNDGSFDEWYPNERGWAGPTAYILYALARAVRLMRNTLPADVVKNFKILSQKAANYLAHNEEGHVLSNHQILACLAVKECDFLLDPKETEQICDHLWHRFVLFYNSEGWSLEYDGADPGYQTATLSFLGKLHHLGYKKNEIEKICKEQLSFIKYFCYPNGEFGGAIGSRSTTTVFHYGFEYWANTFEDAALLVEYFRNSLNENNIISAESNDDHYFLYRINDFFEAHVELIKKSKSVVTQNKIPFEEAGNFVKQFVQAGLCIVKTSDLYVVINVKKGGAARAFSCSQKKQIFSDQGWAFKQQSSNILLTNATISENTSVVSESEIIVKGDGQYVAAPKFNTLTFLVFRIFLFFCFHRRVSFLLKNFIRKILMLKTKNSKVPFERSIHISGDKIHIRDTVGIFKSDKNFQSAYFGHNMITRFVPQVGYLQKSDLSNEAVIIKNVQFIEYKKEQNFIFSRTYKCAGS